MGTTGRYVIAFFGTVRLLRTLLTFLWTQIIVITAEDPTSAGENAQIGSSISKRRRKFIRRLNGMGVRLFKHKTAAEMRQETRQTTVAAVVITV